MRNIRQKSSVYEYRCSAMFMVSMRAEFVYSLASHGRYLHSNRVYALFYMFIMFKKTENPATCKMRSVIRFLNVRNIKLVDIVNFMRFIENMP